MENKKLLKRLKMWLKDNNKMELAVHLDYTSSQTIDRWFTREPIGIPRLQQKRVEEFLNSKTKGKR